MKPLFIVVVAPSGAGKTTLCDMILQSYPEIEYSVSCTTREPRYNEEDGVDYHFITRARFQELLAVDSFLEHAEVHDNHYGTLKAPIYDSMSRGQSVMMDIDVKGAQQVRAKIAALPDDDPMKLGYTDVFISPPSMEELRNRLMGRATDAPEVIERRLVNAEEEMTHIGEFMYNLVNDDLQICFKRFCDIINVRGGII